MGSLRTLRTSGTATGSVSVNMRDKTDFHRLSRREMLKLSPIAVVGPLFFDPFRTWVSEAGLRFSDWVSDKQFDATRVAETLPRGDVTPFEQFPYNYYDVLDPEVDLRSWTLTVEGEVARPGEYTLDQIRS